eukprot:Nk52_evm59s32 gene=Nk52_evmTU59s32
MLVKINDADETYIKIKEDALVSRMPVLIFISPDADALCACKILTGLLKSDFVQYVIVPVAGYNDLAKANKELISPSNDDDVDEDDEYDDEGGKRYKCRTVVMLNCGGNVDIVTYFNQPDPEVTFYVFDSHRPIHLSNIYADDQVLVFDEADSKTEIPDRRIVYGDEVAAGDEDNTENLFRGSGDDEDGIGGSVSLGAGNAYGSSSDDDDSDEEEEEGNDDNEGQTEELNLSLSNDLCESEVLSGRKKKKRKKSRDAAGGIGGDEYSEEMDDIQAQRVVNRRHRQKVINEYYDGSYYGVPSSMLMYSLCNCLAKESNEHLWLSIIGLTEQYIHERIDHGTYDQRIQSLQTEVARLNVAEGENRENTFGLPNLMNAEDELKKLSKNRLFIRFEEEYRFMLFRHWSLYDSMWHSSYLASRLKVWKQEGKKMFLTLFAKMGIPLSQCKQKYSSMKIDLKNSLRDQLNIIARECDLKHLFYGSFNVRIGFRHQFSASDVAYSVTALLEDTEDIRHDLNKIKIQKQKARADGTLEDDDTDFASKEASAFAKHTLENVFTALDALKMDVNAANDNFQLLKKGIDLAMEQQKAVVRQAESLFSKDAISDSGPFLYAILNDVTDYHFFIHPFNLSKLALFMVDTYREREGRESTSAFPRTRVMKPFVLASMNEMNNTYVVVGVMGSRFGETKKNSFGRAFKQAAFKTEARVKHDGFDASVLEIKKNDLEKFMESLFGLTY